MNKETLKKQEAVTLWEQEAESINFGDFKDSIANTEKLLVFGETGSGKTKFYIDIFRYLTFKILNQPFKFFHHLHIMMNIDNYK